MTADPPVQHRGGLLVYVGGLNERPSSAAPLLTKLGQLDAFADYDLYVFPDRIGSLTRGSLADRGRELAIAISNFWQTQGKPTDIVLIGHSLGGLLVRHAFLSGVGGFGDEPDAWAAHVSRIVLFAAPNRGIEASRLPWYQRWVISVATSLARGWVAADVLRGAPFMTNLRLTWLRTFPALQHPPLVVQLRGTRDRAVLESDSVDLEEMPNSTTVDVYGADHQSIIRPERPDEDRPGEQFALITHALTGDFTDDAGLAPRRSGEGVTDVVFLLHGIRAGIFGWVAALADILRAKSSTVFVEEQSYGYFSAWKFTLPWGNDRQFRMFADWYSEMLSTYGDARFHFVGHSNGTYVFGRSLERVPAIRFARIYLAGSVLPTDFAWTKYRRRGQVVDLVNGCGNRDVPVGWLCKALRALGRKTLGTAGFAGFEDTAITRKQFVTVQGGHGAGLEEPRLEAVADFVLTGAVPAGDAWTLTKASTGFTLMSKFAGWLSGVVVLVVISLLVCFIVKAHWLAAGIELGVIALVLIVLSAI